MTDQKNVVETYVHEFQMDGYPNLYVSQDLTPEFLDRVTGVAFASVLLPKKLREKLSEEQQINLMHQRSQMPTPQLMSLGIERILRILIKTGFVMVNQSALDVGIALLKKKGIKFTEEDAETKVITRVVLPKWVHDSKTKMRILNPYRAAFFMHIQRVALIGYEDTTEEE